MRLPTRHKLATWFAGYFCADKTFDIASEHLTLAAHETLTHLGLWGVSIPLASVVIGTIVYFVHHTTKGSTNA